MMNTEILNFKILLKAINKKSFTGEDLRLSASDQNLYLSLRDARQAARTIERQISQGLETTESPDWNKVFDQAVLLLSTKTKDIEITAWLCEALIRLHGFAGLKEGFTLIKQYIEEYWETLYPMPDEEGIYSRIAALAGLNGNDTDGTLIIPIAKVFLTESKASGPFSLWQYQQASELLKITSEKQDQRIKAGTATIEMIEAAAAETAPEFFEKLLQELQDCLNIFEELDNILTEKCGTEAPPTSRISGKLKDCLNAVQNISKKSMIFITPNLQDHKIKNADVDIDKNSNSTDREKMLNMILEAANFFRQTEPHSPLPYLLERAVRWGKMPLPLLLREIVQDDQSWSNLCNLTGIEVESK